MGAEEIANKLWNLCNVLRDDGVTYHQYLNELTYILFLRLSEVKKFDQEIPEEYRWETLKNIEDNQELFDTYRDLLANISKKATNKAIKEIYTNASTTLRRPVNLRTLITNIDKIDWYEEVEQDKIATIYEELLEKNAGEKKSGAGQYFTPRPLINIMTELTAPKLKERWNDPACGTFGFMIAINEYLKAKTTDFFDLGTKDSKWQKTEALSGVELVTDAHRLAVMNAKLHSLDSKIEMADSLSSNMTSYFKDFDGILANPPFGTSKGEKVTRDFTFETSNKQLNFLQLIYNSLKKDGKARAAVVLPDNVLFEDGIGSKVREDLLNKCNLHTILRLPTGIFYAAGVKTNVLFFTRGKSEDNNTKNIWYYDMRSDAPSYGKRTPFTRNAFEGFVKAYTGGLSLEDIRDNYDGVLDDKKRSAIKDERWSKISIDTIKAKAYSLDMGLLQNESLGGAATIEDPKDIAQLALDEIADIQKALKNIIKELR